MFDFIAVALCIMISVVIGLRASRGIETCRDFVLTDRKFTTFTMVAAIFPLAVGSSELLNGIDQVCQTGFVLLIPAIGFVLQAALYFFISKKIRNYTHAVFPGDIMRDGYGKRGQKIFGICTCIRAFGDTLLQFIAMTYICTTFFKVDHPALCVFVICLAATSYCAFGGVKAITLTDIFQLLVFAIAFPIIASIVLHKSGGLMNIMNHIPSEHLRIFDHPNFWYCTMAFLWFAIPSDVIVMHRIMIAKNVEQANQALRITMLLYFSVLILMVLLGFCSLTLGNTSSGAFSHMFDTTLPYGFKGLAAAGLIAVSMSAFATNLNLLAISFTRDIMTPFLKASMSDKDELLTMRIMTVAFSVIVCLVACGINIADPTVYFDNVFTMIVFPSMVMLLMGFSYSRKAFLSGVFASAAILLLIIVFGNGDAQTYLVLPIIMLNIGIMYAVNKCKFAKKTKK